jgi:hypothetical protein
MSPARRQFVASILIPVLIALCGVAISAFASYTHNDKALSNRISTIEAKQEDDRRTLGEIKVTLDKVYDKVAGW